MARTSIRLIVTILVVACAMPARARQQRNSPSPAPNASAAIAGIVVSTDATPQPLRRAIVSVRTSEPVANRSAVTDDDGRFVIRDLPAGRVIIGATKPGYVATTYGATRPGRPGTPVALVAGQTFDAKISMFHAAVMTGILRDEQGRPVPDIRVIALDARQPAPPSLWTGITGGSVTTDDRGVYRLFDIVPGEYLIVGLPPSAGNGEIARRSTADNDAAIARLRNRAGPGGGQAAPTSRPSDPPAPAALAPIYFSGTTTLSNATRVKVGTGEVREGLDFTMTVVPVTTIEGAVVSGGPLPSSLQMFCNADNVLQFPGYLAGGSPRLAQRVGDDGSFKYTTVPPGHYVLAVRGDFGQAPANGRGGRGAGAPSPPPPPPVPGGRGDANPAETMFAVEEVDVSGSPVSGATLRLQRGTKITGRVRFDAASLTPPADLSTVQVNLQLPVTPGYRPAGIATSQTVSLRADGTFAFVGVAPGPYVLQVTLPSVGAGWWLRSAIVNGHDVLDSSLDVTLGSDIENAALTMTDRRPELSGTLQTASGLPAPEYFVIAMPADSALWTKNSRRVRSTRPASDGRFVIPDLPPGDYLLVALTDVEPNEWQQPDFLASIASAGVRVSIGEGEKKTQDLQIRR